jgi:methylated-DNA-[protein]-cysteine S-methyltransferase
MSFNERVYELMRKIPKGRVTTYKIIAEKLGTKAYRAVGNACNRNPYSPEVPCHRVVSSSGKIGGFASGPGKKIEILKTEGVDVSDGKIVDFDRRVFKF